MGPDQQPAVLLKDCFFIQPSSDSDGIRGADIDLAIAAKNLIVECEKIVPEADLRSTPEKNSIASFYVDAIVEQPFGGYPSAVPGYYDYDWDFWVHYPHINKGSQEEIEKFWKDYVIETADDWDFLAIKVGTDYSTKSGKRGWNRLFELRTDPKCGYKPNLKRSL